jgi:sec-independent protein translocase protein TatA
MANRNPIMIPVTLAMLGWMEIALVALVVLLFFGARKLPQIFRGVGEGIREFKKASRDTTDDIGGTSVR